jgi:uncharacterized membrane protein HdeD (DUF308 family)
VTTNDLETPTMTDYPAEDLRPVTSLWWLLLLFGVAVLGLGIFFVASPSETLTTISVIVGIFLLVDGVIAVAAAIFGKGEGRGTIAMVGVLSAIAGLILIKHPFHTLIIFTLIVGIWFVVAGVVRFVSAFSVHEGRGGNIAIALLDVIAGIVLLAWPDLGLKTVAIIIGVVLIVRGILFIVAGLQMRTLNKALDATAAPA